MYQLGVPRQAKHLTYANGKWRSMLSPEWLETHVCKGSEEQKDLHQASCKELQSKTLCEASNLDKLPRNLTAFFVICVPH